MSRRDESAIQWIAPTSQLAFSLGDPSEWMVNFGPAGNPSVISGAFSDGPPPWKIYDPLLQPNKIILTSQDQVTNKSFTITESGLQVQINSLESDTYSIPIILAPLPRFLPGELRLYELGKSNTKQAISWTLPAQGEIQLLSMNSVLTVDSFLDSSSWMALPENPNLDYPPGHFLPFPLALVLIHSGKGLNLEIVVGQ